MEDARDPERIGKLFAYRIQSDQAYSDLMKEIKNEYKEGQLDPSREVAMIEAKRRH